MKKLPFLTLGFTFVLLACGGGGNNSDRDFNSTEQDLITGPVIGPVEDVEGSEFYSTGNTSSRLSGAVLGNSAANLEQKTRLIPFTVKNPSSAITVRAVYLMQLPKIDNEKGFNGSMTDRMLVVFQNTSNQVICGVGMLAPELYNANGEFLTDLASGFSWIGSLYRRPNNSPINANPYCVSPNEMAYVVRHFTFTSNLSNGETDRFRDAAYAEITLDVNTDEIGLYSLEEELGITPISYHVAGGAAALEINVLFTNKSSEDQCLIYFHIVYLDDQGLPAGFYYFQVVDDIISPGEELSVFVENNQASHGPSSTIRIISAIAEKDDSFSCNTDD